MFKKCVFLSVVMVMIISLSACGGAAHVEEEGKQEEEVAGAPADGDEYLTCETVDVDWEASDALSGLANAYDGPVDTVTCGFQDLHGDGNRRGG